MATEESCVGAVRARLTDCSISPLVMALDSDLHSDALGRSRIFNWLPEGIGRNEEDGQANGLGHQFPQELSHFAAQFSDEN